MIPDLLKIFFLFLLQMTLSNILGFDVCSFVIIALVCYALSYGAFRGFFYGLFAGLLQDLFSSELFGLNMAVLGLSAALCGLLSKRLFKDSLWTQFLIPCLVYYLASVAKLSMFSEARAAMAERAAVVQLVLFWNALFSCIFSPVIFSWLKPSKRNRLSRNYY